MQVLPGSCLVPTQLANIFPSVEHRGSVLDGDLAFLACKCHCGHQWTSQANESLTKRLAVAAEGQDPRPHVHTYGEHVPILERLWGKENQGGRRFVCGLWEQEVKTPMYIP